MTQSRAQASSLPDVGVTTLRLLVASSVHRRWYGPKPPAAMVSGKRDVSGETEAKRWGGKVSYNSIRYIFYVVVKIFNLPVSGPDSQFVGLCGQKFVSGHTKPVTQNRSLKKLRSNLLPTKFSGSKF
jgi:hypothetical protein